MALFPWSRRGEADTSTRADGQQNDYIVDDEPDQEFVRPVRRTYIHEVCGGATTMSQRIAETYARDPRFYSGTYCTVCGNHFPVGGAGEFVWEDGTKVGT